MTIQMNLVCAVREETLKLPDQDTFLHYPHPAIIDAMTAAGWSRWTLGGYSGYICSRCRTEFQGPYWLGDKAVFYARTATRVLHE